MIVQPVVEPMDRFTALFLIHTENLAHISSAGEMEQAQSNTADVLSLPNGYDGVCGWLFVISEPEVQTILYSLCIKE